MDTDALKRVADLIASRNEIDAHIASITGRPALVGHLGEWIAAEVFGIELEVSASAKAVDGRFTPGPLAGRMVNIKCYGKRDGILDMTEDQTLDYYLVLTGPRVVAQSSRGTTRPMLIDAVYLSTLDYCLRSSANEASRRSRYQRHGKVLGGSGGVS
jgi:hypothetical protein